MVFPDTSPTCVSGAECFGIDQPVGAASLAPHGHPYSVSEVSFFLRCDTKFFLVCSCCRMTARRFEPDVAVNCAEWHQAIRNSNNFMLVSKLHQKSIIVYYVTTGARRRSRK